MMIQLEPGTVTSNSPIRKFLHFLQSLLPLLPWIFAIFILGVLLIIWSDQGWYLAGNMKNVVKEVGTAFVSAALIAPIIDLIVAQRQTNHSQQLTLEVQESLNSKILEVQVALNANVDEAVKVIQETQANKLLQTLMPASIYEHIDLNVIKAPYLREGLIWTIDLQKSPDPDYVKLTTTREYTIYNIFTHPHIYLIDAESSVEPDIEAKYPGCTKFTKLVVGPDEFFGTNLDPFVSSSRKDSVALSYSVPLEANQRLTILIQDEDVARADDFLNLTTPDMANGYEVRVFYHEIGAEEYSVSLSPLHPQGELLSSYISKPGVEAARMQAGVLPYHGVSIDWRRRVIIAASVPLASNASGAEIPREGASDGQEQEVTNNADV